MNTQHQPPIWRKSTRCASAACVEVAEDGSGGGVHVRDSKLGDDSPVVTFEQADWRAFVTDLRTG